MDAELKAKWVKALRSGQYEQGQGVLYNRDTGHYCCLGVLAEVAGVFLDPDGKPQRAGHLRDHYDILDQETQSDLWRMNDNHGKSFPEIADWIEKNL